MQGEVVFTQICYGGKVEVIPQDDTVGFWKSHIALHWLQSYDLGSLGLEWNYPWQTGAP